ncbi:hypothetical protein SEMRO_527_G160760.1 [Seminavis robusta]|uniref:Uncharacterized protein n=1 Tax=Seminavis robusta TaxID=568900 RepID=A0A9N8HGV1_9STRA|nr:hypothetical protein SEMRO_527_G160760.1 [Seminavis robusta]|eukprot:Sro527_g160760.1 n/a (333) ;mRNA; f:57253-58328
MTSFVPIDHFTKTTLTAIPPDEKPNYNSLKIIHQELNANAMTIPTALGGGHYGHLALVLQPSPTTTYQIPSLGKTQNIQVQPQITGATETTLQKQLLEAVPDTFTKALKNELYGYAQVTVRALLEHLDTKYGKVDADDLVDNIKRMDANWSPDQPIEDLFNQVKDAQKFAADHDPITDKMAVRAAIANLTNSGVFTDAMKDWRKKEEEDQAFTDLEKHFTSADKERRRILTPKQVGYANKATEKPTKGTANKTQIGGIPMYYCWSHGQGPNSNHTSNTCTKKLPGHRDEATADDMLGGCCVIHRRAGEKAVYRRPQRPSRENEENQVPPTNT